MKTAALALTALLACASAGVAQAQSVTLTGMLGGKALLIVDGAPPKSVAAGETYRSVKVIATQGEQAVVEIAGQRHTLRVGEAPASVGAASAAGAGGNKVVLTAGSGGHFLTQGQINGQSVQLLVDTGATLVAMSEADARRIGLNYKAGEPIRTATANGMTSGWRIKLASVRLGDVVVHDVDAAVTPGAMPFILLGNSYLTRFQMARTNDQLVLEKRY